MSIVNCEICGKQIDLDVEDDYAISDDNKYLCDNCSVELDTFDEFGE